MVQGDNGNFPILCESCLGENPYVRMLKDPMSAKCKMCENPFTVFKWRPGRGEGFKRTEVCQVCSKTKNLCQTCILDLQCGLPSQLRDAVLEAEGDIAVAESDVGRNYQNQQRMALVAKGEAEVGISPAERLVEIARQASLQANREQHRVRLQINPTGGVKRPLDESTDTYAYSAYDTNNSMVFSPDIAAAAHGLPVIPAAMRSFVNVPSGAVSAVTTATSNGVGGGNKVGGDKSDKSVVKKKTAKKAKQVFAPRPPAGPPPPSAFVQ